LQQLMTERRVIRQKFQNLSWKKCIICMSVQLNILCLICINHQYLWNCMEFDNDAWVLSNFHSKYSKTRMISNTLEALFATMSMRYINWYLHYIWLVQTTSYLYFDNNHQSFWKLINRSVQCVLALLRPGVEQNFL